MTNKEESQLVVTDLPIALYLNQQVTFDILGNRSGGVEGSPDRGNRQPAV